MTESTRVIDESILERVLIVVKGARDAELTQLLLERAGVSSALCSSVEDLCRRMEEGASSALLAEEVLTPHFISQLALTLARQPPWSDFPLIVFSASADADERNSNDVIRRLGNVTFLDRPVRTRSMLAAVHSAIRSRRRQYEARRAIESRDTFLAMLGHELRNPLGAIRLAIAMLEKQWPAGGAPKEHGILERQSRHLTRLVDDLLDVARVTHGKVVLTRERLNVVDVVRSAFDSLEARARAQGLSYEFRLATPTEIWVEGDRQRLEQVFSNLLTNAIKYTPSGGAIWVTVEESEGAARIVVNDSGVGIAPEMLEAIFDIFAQVDRSLERRDGGIGIGLSLARTLVQLHQGTVEARSEGPNRGSAFVVRLPTSARPAPRDEPSSSQLGERATSKRVVVVEDSADIRELVDELLRQQGHQVTCAEDGPEGLEKILRLHPDIAFVDVGLPGFDGLELARRARAAGSTTRLVAVTGYGQPEDRARAKAAGFDAHMTKPIVEADIHRAMADDQSRRAEPAQQSRACDSLAR